MSPPVLSDGDLPAETAGSSTVNAIIRPAQSAWAKIACIRSQLGVAAGKQSAVSTRVDASPSLSSHSGEAYAQSGGICRCVIAGVCELKELHSDSPPSGFS